MPDQAVQVLFIIAARLAPGEPVAYERVLKQVGALFQTMYLSATAMGLAPCALGGGDSALFARLAGADPNHETSVGEFLLGSKPCP